MQRSQEEVEEYLEEMEDYRDCLQNEYEDARSEAERVLKDWDYEVRKFNNR